MALAETGVLLSPSSSRVHRWLRGLSLIAVLSSFALVILGGVVRVTGSGLGCPDWPLCDGGVLPPLETEAVIEYAHRLVALVLVGPLVLATCGVAWIAFRRELWMTIPAALAVLMLLGQAVLGGVTVVNDLPGILVTAHLALGEALLGCLVLIAVIAHRGPPTLPNGRRGEGPADRFPWLALASGGAVYVLLLSGSYVTTTGATGACLDWPLCQGDIAGIHRLQIIHMVHRFAAALIGLLMIHTLVGFRQGHRPPDVRLLSVAVAALFLAQVMVGAATVWLKFPAEIRALHLGMATAVWVAIAALAALSFTGQRLPGNEPAHA